MGARRCAEPRRATALLCEHLKADSVGLFGDRVHVVTQDSDQATAQAEAVLGSAGLEHGDIRPIEPALEDVFISVVANEELSARG